MKSIGWCLDHIQMELVWLPKEVTSDEGKKKAKKILDDLHHYSKTLVELITHKNFKKNMSVLEHSSVHEVKLQSHELVELIKDLEHMIYVLDNYINELTELLRVGSNKWASRADQLALMIEQKFGGERGELKKEFSIDVHTKDELKQLISSEEHLAEFLK